MESPIKTTILLPKDVGGLVTTPADIDMGKPFTLEDLQGELTYRKAVASLQQFAATGAMPTIVFDVEMADPGVTESFELYCTKIVRELTEIMQIEVMEHTYAASTRKLTAKVRCIEWMTALINHRFPGIAIAINLDNLTGEETAAAN